MNIREQYNNTTTFDTLDCGDIFVYNNIFFMKTEERRYNNIVINAVRLNNGGLTDFNDDDNVEEIDGEFVIQR